MNKFLDTLKKSGLVRNIASIKITVVCLFLLFVLTFWGTVAQVDQGLYLAQEKFFHSWYFLAFNFLPFPGAQLVLWVLFFNLCAVSVTRFVYKWSHIGILIIHLGLLSYFVAAFCTLHLVEESNLTLREGEGGNTGSAYHLWEVSVWKEEQPEKKNVYAYDLAGLKPGDILKFDDFGFEAAVKLYFANADAFVNRAKADGDVINAAGIHELSQVDKQAEPEKNFPGLIFELRQSGKTTANILLFGKETQPTQFDLNGQRLNFQVRRKRFPLPTILTLKKFEMEQHPGTEIARSYKSYVTVDHQGVKRDAEIYMNHPFRYKNYTFYQASYSVDNNGQMRSTLAVVKNTGRLLPYISSLLTFTGLATHFLMMAFKRRQT